MLRLTKVNLTKDGTSSISTKLVNLRIKDLMKNLASISTEHSTLDQECQ